MPMWNHIRKLFRGEGGGWLARVGLVLVVVIGHGLLIAWMAGSGGEALRPPPEGSSMPGLSGQVIATQVLEPPKATAPAAPLSPAPASPTKKEVPKPAASLSEPPADASGPPPAPELPEDNGAFRAAGTEPATPGAAMPEHAASAASAAAAGPGAAASAAAGLTAAVEEGAKEAEPVPVPVYPTRLPPAFTLEYELRRGALQGVGELSWRPGQTYLLRLEGRVPILGTIVTQTSEGRADMHGLAPTRFADRRLGRGEVAAVFEREAGQIRFSGSEARHPLHPGTQDRLSWMVQLAAIGAAFPERLQGGKITLPVAGARGDVGFWTFRVLGRETLTIGAHALETVRLQRETRRPKDAQVDVWLAPAAHHLPVRARQTDARGETFELTLSSLPLDLRK